MSLGSRFLASLVQGGSVTDYLAFGKLGHLFDVDPVAKPLYDFVDGYVKSNSALPPASWVKEKLGIELLHEDVATGALHKELFERYMSRAMKHSADEANKVLKDDPKKAFEIMLLGLQEIGAAEQAPMVSDFRQIIHDFWPIFAAQWSGGISMISWKWPTLQDQSKGMRAGDLISVVGRPGLGKTWLLLSSALHTWKTTGKPVLFISNEMMREIIMERLAAVYTGTPMEFFKDGICAEGTLFGAKGKAGIKKKLAQAEKEPSPFWVVDANQAASVEDVVALAQQYAVAAVYDDGAYMHSPPTNRMMNMQERVAANTNLLKQKVATALKIPCVASWQFSREAVKLKEGAIPGLEHIGYSDVIGQASSIVTGLFQSDNSANPELLYKRMVHILKGRGGETGSFLVDWNFQTMAFDEHILKENQEKKELIY